MAHILRLFSLCILPAHAHLIGRAITPSCPRAPSAQLSWASRKLFPHGRPTSNVLSINIVEDTIRPRLDWSREMCVTAANYRVYGC